MNAETRAKELFPLAFGETLSPEQAAFRDRIATAILSAENDKLEEAAQIVERITQAQAQGWREHPKEEGCGGAIAVSNGGTFAAEAIRNLISQKD